MILLTNNHHVYISNDIDICIDIYLYIITNPKSIITIYRYHF